MIEVIDGFLSHSYLRDLQNYFLTQKCTWHMNDAITGDSSYGTLGSLGFVIPIYKSRLGLAPDEEYGFDPTHASTLVRALVLSAQDKVRDLTRSLDEVIRVRADMTVYNPDKHCHELHTDYMYEHTTAIFYMNTSDGNTLIYDRKGESLLKEVEPIENRLIIFDGMLQHTGHSPAKHKSRMIFNMNFMNPDLIKSLNEEYHKNMMKHMRKK